VRRRLAGRTRAAAHADTEREHRQEQRDDLAAGASVLRHDKLGDQRGTEVRTS
jgi:hypothetical protein